jgi:enamine deaminase RidA (YjgF/YER057c/UK114 family)
MATTAHWKGPFIAAAGTTPYDPATQKLLYPEDAGKQAIVALAEIIQAIKSVGLKGAEDVIRVRVFLAVSNSNTFTSLIDNTVQKMDDIEAVGNAFSTVFAKDGRENGRGHGRGDHRLC